MTLEERISALETRVKQLEAQVGTPVYGAADIEARMLEQVSAQARRLAEQSKRLFAQTPSLINTPFNVMPK